MFVVLSVYMHCDTFVCDEINKYNFSVCLHMDNGVSAKCETVYPHLAVVR